MHRSASSHFARDAGIGLRSGGSLRVGAAGGLSADPSVTLYRDPFTVSANGPVTFVAFDLAGNVSDEMVAVFTITNDPTPAAPVIGVPTHGQANMVNVTWSGPAVLAGDPPILGYGVQVYNAADLAVGALQETDATATAVTISGLTADVPYVFTVQARNVNGFGTPSAKSAPVRPHGAFVAPAGADQAGIARGTTVTLDGSGSSVGEGTTYLWTQKGGPAVVLANPNAASASFTYPLFKHPVANAALTFTLTVTNTSLSRTSDEVTITSKPDVLTFTQARWRFLSETRLAGTATSNTAVLTFDRGGTDLATGLSGPVFTAPVTWVAPVVVGGPWSWEVRIRTTLIPDPRRVTVESSLGATATLVTTR